MARKTFKRLHPVKTLYEMLPKGLESGKEFARIIDILLFQQFRRSGEIITLFDDAAGDYNGLDSFTSGTRINGTTGFQYKFYPSPLTSKHRSEIEKSILRAKKLNLKKWILVTPCDMIESVTKKKGGDVTWFVSLSKKLKIEFELEHWGHKKLLSLFIETPSICLFYYPELVPERLTQRDSILEIRKCYNNNLNTLYGKIECVGMPIYNQEATLNAQMENIYIPLTAVPEQTSVSDQTTEINSNISCINPLTFLKPGCNHVILGDPGSGKSTMLKFLALVGISRALQRRYKAKPDKRLPIYIILRRYADELKSRKNLSLIDYIIENIQGDFNLKSADLDFFEYYLKSGQAILLFDGLDELPNPSYKQDVVKRICTLLTTYKYNTVVVTSRIVGYGSPFRFDEKDFSHYRLIQLKFPEIQQFVKDWYAVRIESPKKRDDKANDLIHILREKELEAIGKLAKNPLLLTIIALVHCIGSVLPDERIELYRICTETLLNTWYNSKFCETEVKYKGNMAKRNQKWIEAIAFWMHTHSNGITGDQRAVVPYKALKQFLTNYINKPEIYRNFDEEPEDQAVDFLEFVKKRTGLLIEIGDNEYGFIHLNFQEYLSAKYIATILERDGVISGWELISKYRNDDHWLEVIRLLIANFKSEDSQTFLVNKIMNEIDENHHLIISRLLSGLLLDGIESAEIRKYEIFQHLLRSAIKTIEKKEMSALLSMIGKCLTKEKGNEAMGHEVFAANWQSLKDKKQKIASILTATSLNWSAAKIYELTGNFLTPSDPDTFLYKIFFIAKTKLDDYGLIREKIEDLRLLQDYLSLVNPYLNFVSAAFQSVFSLLDEDYIKNVFELQLITLFPGIAAGPFLDFNKNNLDISENAENFNVKYNWTQDRARDIAKCKAQALTRALDLALFLDHKLDQDLDLVRDRAMDRARTRNQDQALVRARNFSCDWTRILERLEYKETFKNIIATVPELYSPILDILVDAFNLKPQPQWWEALRVGFLRQIPGRITLFDKIKWENVKQAFKEGSYKKVEIYSAAWQLMFDSWLYMCENHNKREESIFEPLASLTKNIQAPPLKIAHCIRDLTYGDESRIDDLVSIIHSKDPQYREIFEKCLWLPHPQGNQSS